ncbi:hypothetical protein LY76DRAFT_79493 [Colletotrichum caudatum]|nr:hypothetical protein LY76DRAFT_79493 [Colletotrichum caudatum]
MLVSLPLDLLKFAGLAIHPLPSLAAQYFALAPPPPPPVGCHIFTTANRDTLRSPKSEHYESTGPRRQAQLALASQAYPSSKIHLSPRALTSSRALTLQPLVIGSS